jgi:peptide/nickel transport system substrate-binding protein
VLVPSEPEHLDPRYPGDALGATISRLLYASLLENDPRTFVPRLAAAEALEVVDPGTVRARLRTGLRFHDGTPLTARDVAATYEAVLDPARGSTLRGTYARVFRGVRALDERTIEFALTGSDGTYPSLLQLPIVRARDAAGTEIAAVEGNEARFVGAGPMRVRSLARGAWVLDRVAAVPGRPRSVRFLTMRDPNTLALRLLHGDADVAEVKSELFPLFEGRARFSLASARSVGFTYLGLRNDHPALARREVRHAIAHAIDREALMAGKLGAYAVASTGPLPPTHWAYAANVARYPYDPARARRLLDTVLPRPAGGGPRTRLVLRATNVRFTMTIARAIAEMLAAVDIDVDVRQSDLAAVLSDLRAARYDLTVLTMPDLSDPWGIAWLFATSSMPSRENPRAGGNRWRYSNPALDAALEAGRRALGPDARRPHYAEAQRILAEDLPVVPLWHADLVYAGGTRVRGLRPRGDGQLDWLLDLELAT